MKKLLALLLALVFVLGGCGKASPDTAGTDNSQGGDDYSKPQIELPEFDINNVPPFSGNPYYIVNDNAPNFTAEDITTQAYEYFSPLDSLGRCGVTKACIGIELMPTEERGNIGSVKPTGWHTVKYDNVDGKYLYNRCHLIGFQLSGENANTQNLITGTRYMNVQGMLPFENMVADYVKETKNHVLYRVTPVFEGNNLLASGVLMEAYSVEDNGEGICFFVYCYNAQPNIAIDYATGESEYLEFDYDISTPESDGSADANDITYILNTNSKKFHYPNCGSAKDIKEHNRQTTNKSREELIADGYSPCGNCKP